MSKYFVYVLQSEKDNNFYIGFTSDLQKRLLTHNSGKVRSTKNRKPFVCVYSESFDNIDLAVNREKFLKSGSGREFIKSFLKRSI